MSGRFRQNSRIKHGAVASLKVSSSDGLPPGLLESRCFVFLQSSSQVENAWYRERQCAWSGARGRVLTGWKEPGRDFRGRATEIGKASWRSKVGEYGERTGG